jgi:hypothetical protein
MRYRVPERQIQEELDHADQVAAPTTPVTVEQVLVGIDLEARKSLLV